MEHLRRTLENTDWTLLARQKAALAGGAADPTLSLELRDACEGVLSFLDALGDAAELDGFEGVFHVGEAG